VRLDGSTGSELIGLKVHVSTRDGFLLSPASFEIADSNPPSSTASCWAWTRGAPGTARIAALAADHDTFSVTVRLVPAVLVSVAGMRTR
jgi:hypothetical protein